MEIERILCEALGATVPNTPQPVVPLRRAADAILSRRRKESHDGTRTAGIVPWRWLFIALLILAFFALLV
jgi:hypothetical protein